MFRFETHTALKSFTRTLKDLPIDDKNGPDKGLTELPKFIETSVI